LHFPSDASSQHRLKSTRMKLFKWQSKTSKGTSVSLA
jgi:hypothetical protein